MKICIGITQDNYPETIGKIFILNGGYFFKGIWNVVKIWIDPVTRKKISICTGSGKKELLEDIDEDQLHIDLGGKFEGSL